MDDLISREAAIEYLMTNMGWRDEDGYEVDDADEKRAIITDLLNGVPAVDAIPLDWLREKMRGYSSSLKSTETAALVMVMQMWQKEQEKQGIEPKEG